VKKIVISVINDLVTDQRLLRIARTLVDDGYSVHIIGRKLPNSLSLSDVVFTYHRFRMVFTKGPLFYAFFNLRLLVNLLLIRKPALLYSIDLDTLAANSIASRMRGIPLVYDSHEYFTEVPELVGRNRVKKFWEFIERRYLPAVKHAITVSNSIAAEYLQKYGVSFITVRNVPEERKQEKLEPVYPVSDDKEYRIIYQGALNLGRGIELMIRSMQFQEEGLLYIAGDGDITRDLQKLCDDLDLNDRVIFAGRLSPVELQSLTMACDLGLSLEEDMGLSYRMSLPNKIFDYVQARIPVICSDLPEMKKLVSSYGIGEMLEKREPEELAIQIKRLLAKNKEGVELRQNLEKAAHELNWENEKGKLVELIRNAIPDV